MGVSISRGRANCETWSGSHREGFMVEIGPTEGPEQNHQHNRTAQLVSGDQLFSTGIRQAHTWEEYF